MRKFKIFLLMLISSFSLFFTSCSKGDEKSDLKLNYESKEIFVNDSFKLQLLKDGIILTSGVEFSSNDKEVASVDKNGLVLGLKKGETTINAKFNDSVSTCKVSVKQKDVIALSKSTLILDLGTKETITLNKNNEPITSDVIWEALDKEVALVENGVVTPVSVGETTIIAKYNDKAYSLNVVITKPFTEFGNYEAHRSVPEMGDVRFDFTLVLNSDGTYQYHRLDAYSSDETLDLSGCLVSEGTFVAKNGLITMTDTREDKNIIIELNITKSGLKSVGEITVENGYTSELTFTKSK